VSIRAVVNVIEIPNATDFKFHLHDCFHEKSGHDAYLPHDATQSAVMPQSFVRLSVRDVQVWNMFFTQVAIAYFENNFTAE